MAGTTQTIGEVVARFGADVSQFVNAVQQVSGLSKDAATQMRTMKGGSEEASGGITGFAKNLMSGVTQLGQFIFFGKQAVTSVLDTAEAIFRSASSWEQMSLSMENLLGSGKAATSMLNDLDKFADATPFEFEGLVKASQRMLSMGYSANEVLPTLKAIGSAVMATGGDTSGIDSVITALNRMKDTGTLTSLSMRSLISQGLPAWQILAKGLGTDVAGAMAKVKSGAIDADTGVRLLTEGMQKMAPNILAGYTNTFAGSIKRLKEFAEDTWRVFSMPIMKVFSEQVSNLGKVLDTPAFAKFAEMVGTTIAKGLSTVVGWVTQAIGLFTKLSSGISTGASALGGLGSIVSTVLSIFSPWGNILKIVVGAFQQLGASMPNLGGAFSGLLPLIQTFAGLLANISGVVGQVVGMLATVLAGALRGIISNIGPVISAFTQLATMLGGILSQALKMIATALSQINWAAIGAAIGALAGGAMKILASVLQVVMVAFQALWPVISQVVGIIINTLVPVINMLVPIITPIIQSVVQFAQSLAALLMPIIQMLAPLITGVLTQIRTIWNAVFPALLPVVQAIFGLISNAIKTAMGVISGIIKLVTSIIKGDWSGAWNAIKSIGETIWNGIVGALRGVANLIGSIISGLVGVVKNLFSGLWNAVSGIWNSILSTISGIINNIRNTVVGIVSNIVSSVTGFFSGLWRTITDIAQNIFNALTWPFRAAYDAIAGVVNGIIGFVQNALGWLGRLIGVPGAQHGVRNWPGGVITVGEAGEEKVWLPPGSNVYPHGVTPWETFSPLGPQVPLYNPAMPTSRGPVTLVVQLDGREMAMALGSHMAEIIRVELGVLQ